jgi:hypothetical protein
VAPSCGPPGGMRGSVPPQDDTETSLINISMVEGRCVQSIPVGDDQFGMVPLHSSTPKQEVVLKPSLLLGVSAGGEQSPTQGGRCVPCDGLADELLLYLKMSRIKIISWS